MFNLLLTISMYCIATGGGGPSRRKCVKEVRQCVKKKQQSPLGTEVQYLDECVTEREK